MDHGTLHGILPRRTYAHHTCFAAFTSCCTKCRYACLFACPVCTYALVVHALLQRSAEFSHVKSSAQCAGVALCPVLFVWTAASRLKTTATLCRIDRGSAPPVSGPLCCRSTDKAPPDFGASCTLRCDAIAVACRSMLMLLPACTKDTLRTSYPLVVSVPFQRNGSTREVVSRGSPGLRISATDQLVYVISSRAWVPERRPRQASTHLLLVQASPRPAQSPRYRYIWRAIDT
ncbi:hypothetical protein V8C44DRAFT_292203 [Trichoderma aethiopicum]